MKNKLAVSSGKISTSEFSTDDVAVSVFNNLLSDFRSVHNNFAPQATLLKRGKRETYRDLGLPDYRSTLVPRFKAYYQLDSLFKKYRFQDELMTEAELEKATYEKYNAFQAKRSQYGIMPYRAALVIKRARLICKDILANFDWDEVYENAQFGRNSSVGCNFANAYLDHKLAAPEALTGTVCSQAFTKGYLTGDPLLTRILKGKFICLHEALPLIIVPKKYNIGRTIMPLTLFSLLLSHGLGKVVAQRLSNYRPKRGHRLNIKWLQAKHRDLVRQYSLDLTHATLDMSFGSENIISALLNMLLPRKWYNALKMTFNRQNLQNGVSHYTESVLPMGNGATFPVETLIFYSLVRAIGDLLGVSGTYSVYGDDVIVPSKIYRYVLAVFEDLGIAVNREKSFCLESFRESCGADYYNGASVRPFYMPDGMKCSRRNDPRYVSWLYKCVNGLLARWSPEEIPCTLKSLLIELAVATSGKVLAIPPSFPDGCGVKWKRHDQPPIPGFAIWNQPRLFFAEGTRMYSFEVLLEVPKRRRVLSTVAYFWDQLRSKQGKRINLPNTYKTLSENVLSQESHTGLPEWKSLVLNDYLRYVQYSSPPMLTYRSKRKLSTYTNKKGVAVKDVRIVWSAFVADKQCSTFVTKSVGREPYQPSNEGMEPIITDWI